MPHPQKKFKVNEGGGGKRKKKKRKGGEAIGKPDLGMDTWSDAGQTKLFRQNEAVSVFQTKYSPLKVVHYISQNQTAPKNEAVNTKNVKKSQ